MEVLFQPKSHLLGFLEPLDLLKLLRVSKTTRKAAVPYLRAFESQALTAHHAQLFSTWLTTAPIITEHSRVFDREMRLKKWTKRVDRNSGQRNVAGPLRFDVLQEQSQNLVRRFVVLQYEKRSYQREHCKVATFDEKGGFVAYYELNSMQLYESVVDREVLFGASCNCSTPEIEICTCSAAADWMCFHPGLHWEWEGGFSGDVTRSNFELFDSFFGLLSPTEVSFVLMHALSQDTRVICQYVQAVFDCFRMEFEFAEDEPDEEGNGDLLEWRARLATLSYKRPRPLLRFDVGTPVLCKVDCNNSWFCRPDEVRWLKGEITEHWYRTKKGIYAPYLVRLDKWNCGSAHVLLDEDSPFSRSSQLIEEILPNQPKNRNVSQHLVKNDPLMRTTSPILQPPKQWPSLPPSPPRRRLANQKLPF